MVSGLGSEGGDADIETAWKKVEAEWDDERSHNAFLLLCSGTGRLGEAGRRYRAVKETDPSRAAVAQRQVDRVLGLAMQSLSALKTEPTVGRNKRVLLFVAFVLALGMIATALWAMLRLK